MVRYSYLSIALPVDEEAEFIDADCASELIDADLLQSFSTANSHAHAFTVRLNMVISWFQKMCEAKQKT